MLKIAIGMIDLLCNQSRMDDMADRKGIIAVYPAGTDNGK